MPVETMNPRLQIPRYVASRALLEIGANVMANPILRNHIRTWVIPGKAMDLPEAAFDPKFVTPASLCPILMLWPEPRDAGPITNVRQQATLNVSVSLWVATVDVLDCMDLYGQVEASVSPDSVTEGDRLQDRLMAVTGWSGKIDLGQPAYASYPSSGGPVMLAEGSFSTKYNVPSF